MKGVLILEVSGVAFCWCQELGPKLCLGTNLPGLPLGLGVLVEGFFLLRRFSLHPPSREWRTDGLGFKLVH